MKKVYSELVEFFEGEEGWDKDELLSDYVAEILKKAGSSLVWADELSITDGEQEIMCLADFAEDLFDKIMQGVCNVIETA